jgi:hypothetical protein
MWCDLLVVVLVFIVMTLLVFVVVTLLVFVVVTLLVFVVGTLLVAVLHFIVEEKTMILVIAINKEKINSSLTKLKKYCTIHGNS